MATTEPSNRRQSGLWQQNSSTGTYEPQLKQSSGPYQYYTAPAASSSSAPRRSFSDRTGNSAITSTYLGALQNKVPGAGSVLDKNRARDLALATHSKIAESLHAYSGDAKSEDFARAGHASEIHSPGVAIPKARPLGSNATKPVLSVDPDAKPANVRSRRWSPEPGAAADAAAGEEAPRRRSSVQEKSPLQALQGKLGDISKVEKRARIEQLENVARQRSLRNSSDDDGPARSNTLRSEKGRVVSDGSRRPSESKSDKYYRQVTAGAPRALPPENGAIRFRRASDALKGDLGLDRQQSTRRAQPIVGNPRPYHHAPEAPRSQSAAHPRPGEPARIAKEPRPYRHAPESPTSVNVAGYPHNANRIPRDDGSRSISNPVSSPRQDTSSTSGMNRTASGNYKHRLRDAGFAGAAAAAAGAAGYGAHEASADRGKAAYDRRKSVEEPSTDSQNNGSLGRSGSRKLQKAYPDDWRASRRSVDQQQQQARGLDDPVRDKQSLQTARMGKDGEKTMPPAERDADPVSRAAVATGAGVPVPYSIPPQTATAQEAKQQVGFGGHEKHHHLGGMFHRHEDNTRSVVAPKTTLEEWRDAKPLRLTLGDVEFEQGSGGRRTSSSGGGAVGAAQYDGPYEEEAKAFRPPLFLKCGPLLRYTGIRKETSSSGRGDREIWRGSVMIVTEDEQSEYSTAPVLRLFAQPMELHVRPSGYAQELHPEDEDPIAGQVKASRTGRPLYVRPVHDIPGHEDLSRVENNSGLYAATRAPMLGPQSISSQQDGRQQPSTITFQDKSRILGRDGEKAGRYRETRAIRLHTEQGFTFWRWSLEIELGSTQHRIAYRINKGPALGFWVPARGESMNMMFHSCNGFSLSVDSNQFSGPDPLWRDVLNRHQSRPFHVMLGGGDQIYNDAAMRDTQLFREWLQMKNPEHKHHAPFTEEMLAELEHFYMERYSMWFSQGLFAMAGSQIPMVNLWDDHDIIDGFGSYPHHFMSSPVFTGLGAVAFKYYMLFQHQSLPAETAREEPSWVLGASPGPYIHELSRSLCLSLGRGVVFLGIDCRTERMRDEILSQQTYDLLFSRAREAIDKGETRHLLVLLGVPIAYPRLNFLENILTSRVMDPIKALGRTGVLGGFVNKFDGGVEILDDLDDHWTARHHKEERNWFIQELQHLAAEKSVRVTILGGDVHLGAVGQFYTPKKYGIAKDRDHRYMPNVISSAIVNTPPPTVMADVLNRRNKVHHLDAQTDEDMIPMFEVDVGGGKRNNKCLLPRRNYCTIREFRPGGTPPPSPPPEREDFGGMDEGRGRAYPPGAMGRSLSLTRGLIRRFSTGGGRGRNPPSSLAMQGGGGMGMGRSSSLSASGARPGSSGNGGRRMSLNDAGPQKRPINAFRRVPTDLSAKAVRRAAAKGGAPADDGQEGDGEGGFDEEEAGHVNLEGGLDVSLNMEVDQSDPSGTTQGYRLLVPALWYQGDVHQDEGRRGVGFMDRFRGGAQEGDHRDEGRDHYDGEDDQAMESEEPQPQQQRKGLGRGMSFMSRFRSRRQRGNGRDDDDGEYYSEEDGAYESPMTSRGVEQGGDGPMSRPGAERVDSNPLAGAYRKGYSLNGPPIGGNRSASQPQQLARDTFLDYSQPHPVPAQKVSQQIPARQNPPQARAGEFSDTDGTGSFLSGEEDEYGEGGRREEPPTRRMSKAERFLGMGGDGQDGGRGQGGRYDDGYADGGGGREKKKWMIWR